MVKEEPTELPYELVLQKIEELEAKARDFRNQPLDVLLALVNQSQSFEEIATYGLEIAYRVHGHQYKEPTALWIAQPWNETAELVPQYRPMLLKAFKTRLKNIVKGGKKIPALHYFRDWLIENNDILRDALGIAEFTRNQMVEIDES